MLGRVEKVWLKVFFNPIIDCKLDALNPSLLVEFLQIAPVQPSLSDVICTHQIDDAIDSSFMQPLHIFFLRWICPDANSWVAYLAAECFSEKVTISFLNMAVDDPDLVPVPPLAWFLLSEFSPIVFRILNLHDTTWFPFIYFLFSTLGITVNNLVYSLQ